MDREISAWTFYNLNTLVRQLAGTAQIGLGAAERIVEEVGLRETGEVLRFETRTQITGELAKDLGLDDEPLTERTWTLQSKSGVHGMSYRLALRKIRDVA